MSLKQIPNKIRVFVYDFARYVLLNPQRSTLLSYEKSPGNLYLTTFDGERIGAYLIQPSEINESTIFFIVCHGKGCDRHQATDYGNLRAKASQNICFLVIDYRGFGDSTGTFTKDGVNLDLDAAFDFIRSNFKTTKIFLLGHSFGSAIALEYCQYLKNSNPKNLPEKTFCLASFTSTIEICREFTLFRILNFFFPNVGEGIAKELNYNNIESAKVISDSLILIHGIKDRLVRYHHSKTISEVSGAELVLTDHDHLTVFSDLANWDKIFKICRK